MSHVISFAKTSGDIVSNNGTGLMVVEVIEVSNTALKMRWARMRDSR